MQLPAAGFVVAAETIDMKTRVRITLRAEQDVEIEVEHFEGDSPLMLSADEIREAVNKGPSFPKWTVARSDVRIA